MWHLVSLECNPNEVDVDMDTVINVSSFHISNALHSRFDIRFCYELHCLSGSWEVIITQNFIRRSEHCYSGFSNGQLSLTGVDIDMDTVKNVKFPEQQCTAQWI